MIFQRLSFLRTGFILALSSFFLIPMIGFAQASNDVGTGRVAAFKQHQALQTVSPFKKMQWRNVGPDLISGRVTEVAGIPGNKNVIFASFATGGLSQTILRSYLE